MNRLMRWFTYAHLTDTEMMNVSKDCAELAARMDDLKEGPEKTAGMRKLLEAKDCFVRAVLEGRE